MVIYAPAGVYVAAWYSRRALFYGRGCATRIMQTGQSEERRKLSLSCHHRHTVTLQRGRSSRLFMPKRACDMCVLYAPDGERLRRRSLAPATHFFSRSGARFSAFFRGVCCHGMILVLSLNLNEMTRLFADLHSARSGPRVQLPQSPVFCGVRSPAAGPAGGAALPAAATEPLRCCSRAHCWRGGRAYR